MANMRQVARLHPPVRDYLRHRRWVRRGDVVAYGPDIECDAFSTDAQGFRRGRLGGRAYGLEAALEGGPHALMLGASEVFGFGLPSDADTIPSRLADLTGLPVLNLSFPEADPRSLVAVLSRVLLAAPRPPAFVAISLGGTLTRYAYSRLCDPLFGPPGFEGAPQGPAAGTSEEDAQWARFRAYTQFWGLQAGAQCAARGVPLILMDGTTAFSKVAPGGPGLNETEASCALTEPYEGAEMRFAAQALREPFGQALVGEVARAQGLPVLHAEAAELSFVDEYHCDAPACARLAERLRPLCAA